MANKLKEIVDYFPFFVNDGRTFYVLKKQFGALGIGYFAELFRMIARTPGHVYSMRDEFDRERLTDFIGSKEHPVDEQEIFDFLDSLASTGKIDPDMWYKKRLIASADFLDSLSEAYRRRSSEPPSIELAREEAENLEDCSYDPRKNESDGNMQSYSKPAAEDAVNMPSICRQYDGNMSEICRNAPHKEKESKVKERKLVGAPLAEADKPPLEKKPPENPKNGKSLSPMQNKTANYYQDVLTSIFPHEAWGDYGKERSQLATLAKKTKALMKTTDSPDEITLAKSIIGAFLDLKKFGKTDFWRNAPVTPSALCTRWSDIMDYLARNHASSKSEMDLSEVHF